MSQFTNSLLTAKHVLVCITEHFPDRPGHIKTLTTDFCGRVVTTLEEFQVLTIERGSLLFLTGDVKVLLELRPDLVDQHGRTFSVRNFSEHTESSENVRTVDVGQLPINVRGVGVFVRDYFTQHGTPYFERISAEHEFQHLTESKKPGVAYRTGAYITEVNQSEEGAEFHLLRCSSNFTGPTNNVQPADREIIDSVNYLASQHFSQRTRLNHVLAQIYHNSDVDGREKKATIKTHSDKTKDMPVDGLMAFCTFYKDFTNLKKEEQVVRSKLDPFDFVYHETSVLTKLRFKRKDGQGDEFDVILYPNSVFLMTLDMNRLYTHEIVPSHLPIKKLPTRMGYVVRCSKTRAIHKSDGKTYIYNPEGRTVELTAPTQEEMSKLRELYAKENLTTEPVKYGFVSFSMNAGDLTAPEARIIHDATFPLNPSCNKNYNADSDGDPVA